MIREAHLADLDGSGKPGSRKSKRMRRVAAGTAGPVRRRHRCPFNGPAKVAGTNLGIAVGPQFRQGRYKLATL